MVASMASGITAAVIKAALILPSSTNNTTMTNSAPSTRFFCTVLIALSTSWVRSYTGSMIIPSGRLDCISATFCDTACATARELPPTIIMAVPRTVSRPSCVAAPVLSSFPIATLPISLTMTGIVFNRLTTTFSISSIVCNCPCERISICCPLRSINPAP